MIPIIESSIKENGITKTYIYIEFAWNVKLTINRYFYEVREFGKGKGATMGELEHEGFDYTELVKKVLEKV